MHTQASRISNRKVDKERKRFLTYKTVSQKARASNLPK
jgi:hypothetical protein